MSQPGNEQIPLDLSAIPTKEAGLALAVERDRALSAVAKTSLDRGGAKVMLVSHLPFLGVLNRAVSLHRGIVSAIEQSNPHVAFTLIRSYLELVALTYTIGKDPSYLERLEKTQDELPDGKRPRPVRQLIATAAKDMPGIGHIYYSLSQQMAHFGSTAMFQAFAVTDEERHLTYTTYPRWKDPDDARIALAMLLENDDTMIYLLTEWDRGLIAPVMERHAAEPEAEPSIG